MTEHHDPKTGKFKKGNKIASKNKGKAHANTQVKNRIKEIASWDTVNEVVEKNIMKLLTSKNEKIMMEATKAFAEFVKPKKRENIHDLKGNIVLEIVGMTKEDF